MPVVALASIVLAIGSASAQAPADTDLDGRPDDVEGEGDIDGDGIPNTEDAHDFWVSGQASSGGDGLVVWLIGAGEDGQTDTADDVVVGKSDGPDFRFQNVNDGPYVVVAGDDPATDDPTLRSAISVDGAPVEGVDVGAGESATLAVDDPEVGEGPVVDAEPVGEEPASSEASAPTALALDDTDSGSDPVLHVLVAIVAFLFGVLLAYQFARLPQSEPGTLA